MHIHTPVHILTRMNMRTQTYTHAISITLGFLFELSYSLIVSVYFYILIQILFHGKFTWPSLTEFCTDCPVNSVISCCSQTRHQRPVTPQLWMRCVADWLAGSTCCMARITTITMAATSTTSHTGTCLSRRSSGMLVMVSWKFVFFFLSFLPFCFCFLFIFTIVTFAISVVKKCCSCWLLSPLINIHFQSLCGVLSVSH